MDPIPYRYEILSATARNTQDPTSIRHPSSDPDRGTSIIHVDRGFHHQRSPETTENHFWTYIETQ